MLTFMFWNFKCDNLSVLAGIVEEQQIDVLVLAECPISSGSILQSLNHRRGEYYVASTDCAKLQIYTRFPEQFVMPVLRKDGTMFEGDDFSIRRLSVCRPEILLCAVHFPSKLWRGTSDQTAFAFSFAKLIAEAERAANHSRTVLVGDLNMNPYEDGVVMDQGLHAVTTRQIARKESRTVKFLSNLYFYNPMWSHFGEKMAGHAGSYYYSSPKSRADFWNIFDQVLIRPELLPYFHDDDVAILHRYRAGDISLVTPEGIPQIADHLPIMFRLHI